MDAIVSQMIILFILVIVGYGLSKKKLMDVEFDRKLSSFVILVSCPCLILSSVMSGDMPDRNSAFAGCRFRNLYNSDRRSVFAASYFPDKERRARDIQFYVGFW